MVVVVDTVGWTIVGTVVAVVGVTTTGAAVVVVGVTNSGDVDVVVVSVTNDGGRSASTVAGSVLAPAAAATTARCSRRRMFRR